MVRYLAVILIAASDFLAFGASSSPQPNEIITTDDRHAAVRRGGELFESLSCSACHETTSSNSCSDGPSLVGIGQRLSRQEILSAIRMPSASIVSGFAECRISTMDGTSVSGYLVSEGSAGLVVRLQCSEERRVIERSEIEEITSSKKSTMPEGLLDGVRAEDIEALLSFLTAL